MFLKIKSILLLLLPVFLILGMSSCSKGDSFEEQIEQINDFVAKKNWTVSEVISEGVYVVIDEAGGADKPNLASEITVKYKGYYIDEQVFDEGDNLVSKLNNLIRGWQLGMPRFGKGGKGKLLITSDKGYGSNPSFGIRANAVLIFEIELLDFK